MILATLCAVLLASKADAQCVGRGALQPRPTAKAVPILTQPGAGFPVWKTIALGTSANSLGLRNALDSAGCGIGDLAEEALARREFAVSPVATNVDLVAVSAADLGFSGDAASLADIYARAEKLGLQLAPAEVAPQLRLQYPDQPVGEFLHVAMKPIKTWEGDEVIFVVANGGAGLILIGAPGRSEVKIPAASRFLFVRPRAVAHSE